LVLVDRDLAILKEIGRWHFLIGKHIKELANFTGSRACDRRLKLLVEAKYINRKKILYGIPYLYTLTHKGRILLGLNKREDKIKLEQVRHDIYVIDTVIYFIKEFQLSLENIITEKELHIKDGFGERKHQPDFVINLGDKKYAVEIELNLKAKPKLEKNIRDNHINFDKQIWLTNDNRVYDLIKNFAGEYSTIDVIRLEKVIKSEK